MRRLAKPTKVKYEGTVLKVEHRVLSPKKMAKTDAVQLEPQPEESPKTRIIDVPAYDFRSTATTQNPKAKPMEASPLDYSLQMISDAPEEKLSSPKKPTKKMYLPSS